MWDMEGMDPAALQQRQEKMQQRWMEMQRKNEAELAAQSRAGEGASVEGISIHARGPAPGRTAALHARESRRAAR